MKKYEKPQILIQIDSEMKKKLIIRAISKVSLNIEKIEKQKEKFMKILKTNTKLSTLNVLRRQRSKVVGVADILYRFSKSNYTFSSIKLF